MLKKISLFVLLVSLAVWNSCYRVPAARSPEYVLYVFAEKEDYEVLEGALEAAFHRITLTPQPEVHFRLKYVAPDSFNNYLAYKQLLFLASLESNGVIADLVKRSVQNPELREKIESGEVFLLKKENQWTRNQLIVTLVASSLDELRKKILDNDDIIYKLLADFQKKTVHNYIYRKLENKDIPKELLDKYQWQIRVPHDYFVALEDSEGQFVFLRRRFPERWFFVKWFENVDPDIVTPEWVMDLRDTIGVKYYGGDSINREYTDSKEINFLGRRCLKITGLWEHEEKVAGGPFFSYAFYDEGTQRVYVIDGAVFAPNRLKLPYLDQLDAMAYTFKTLVDIQKEKANQ